MKRITFFIISLILLFLQTPVLAQTQSNPSPTQQLEDITNQINQLQAQISSIQGTERNLQSELTLIDTQTKITQLKIQQTSFEVTTLDNQISTLNGQINNLSSTIDQLTPILLNRITSTYESQNTSSLDLLFSSHGFSDLLERMKYIEVAQAYDKKLTLDLQNTKETLSNDRAQIRVKQTQEQNLETNLTNYQTQLQLQEAGKTQLIKTTKNSEAIYQQQLQAALAEQQAILSILGGGGSEVSEGPVKTGNVIGHFILGPSPCSNGSHVHLEIHVNNILENPVNYLTPTNYIWDDPEDSPVSFTGNLPWPVFPPIHIEQPFGNTWYAQQGWYTNPPGHTGVDIYSPSSNDVLAVHDGILSSGEISCGGGTLHYKRVDHGNGISSYYLHVL